MVNVVKRNGEVGGVVTGLRGGQRNAIEQKRNLIKGTAVDADVRLYTKATALTDIDARGSFQNVVDGLRLGTTDVVAGDDLNNFR